MTGREPTSAPPRSEPAPLERDEIRAILVRSCRRDPRCARLEGHDGRCIGVRYDGMHIPSVADFYIVDGPGPAENARSYRPPAREAWCACCDGPTPCDDQGCITCRGAR